MNWCLKQGIKGLKAEFKEEKGKTPFLFVEIDGSNKDNANT